MKLRDLFARTPDAAESGEPSRPEPHADRHVEKRAPRQDLELDHASRQVECCRYIDTLANARGHGFLRPRVAITGNDVWT